MKIALYLRRMAFCLGSLGMLPSGFAGDAPPTWNELRRNHPPAWLDAAKFGIYCHWGLQSVRRVEGNGELTYRELIPLFTAENFDPEAWADLFVAAGAEFAGPVAWHGSGYVHWDSALTEWNSSALSPHRDIVGELAVAIKARGLKLLTSFHTGYHYGFPHWEGDPEYNDPRYEGLYGVVHDQDATDVVWWKNHIEKQIRLPEAQMARTVALMQEAVTKYQPDIAWVDTSFGGTTRPKNRGRYVGGKLMPDVDIYLPGLSGFWQRAFIASFFESGRARGEEVEFVYKTRDVPPGVGMRNVENGLMGELTYDPWMTDIDMIVHEGGDHAWFYTAGYRIKDANYLIDLLCDVVSKNGRLLLNVPPMADGSFSVEIQRELTVMGDWLRQNEEAIRGAMPWFAYGEGPSEVKTGHYSDSPGDNRFGAGDVRYTVNGDAVYAILLGWPGGAETMRLRMLGSRGRVLEDEIRDVRWLANGETIEWSHQPDYLEIQIPATQVGRFAHVIKITLR